MADTICMWVSVKIPCIMTENKVDTQTIKAVDIALSYKEGTV